MAFSPDGAWLATLGGDGEVLVCDVARRTIAARPAAHTTAAFATQFVTQQRLVTASAEQLHVTAFAGGQPIVVDVGDGHAINSLDVSPDGRSALISVLGGAPQWIDLETGALRAKLAESDGKSARFLRDGRMIVLRRPIGEASDGGSVTVWTENGQHIEREIVVAGERIEAMEVVPDR